MFWSVERKLGPKGGRVVAWDFSKFRKIIFFSFSVQVSTKIPCSGESPPTQLLARPEYVDICLIYCCTGMGTHTGGGAGT